MSNSENSSINVNSPDVLKPITLCNIVQFYVPLTGIASYTLLSVNIMNPNLRIFPDKDISNLLLINSLIGSGTYIYTREHLKKLSSNEKLLFSVTGALLFSFGSVLIWSVLRSIIPANPTVFTLAGFSTSLAITYTGRKYLSHVDKLCKAK